MGFREEKKATLSLRDARSELKEMSKAEREGFLPREPVSFCVVGGRKCRYLFSYKGYQLSHYEVDGKGCVMEKGKHR
ncbi:MAG: hypothetical protein H6Q48_2456 [Deltaproteobacteria bacterium]|nr:hypothetical protein [Deltaproteobacteria bacterium]